MRTTSATLLLCAVTLSCRRTDPETRARQAEAAAGLGRCTQEEPGSPTSHGHAVYTVDQTLTAGDAAEGGFAAILTCMTPGPSGSAVTLLLPNLADSIPVSGRYRILEPGAVGDRAELARAGWAEARIPALGGLTYRAMGGELVIERVESGALVGSYLVALARAPDALERGPARLVLGGAFAAPRNRIKADAAGGAR